MFYSNSAVSILDICLHNVAGSCLVALREIRHIHKYCTTYSTLRRCIGCCCAPGSNDKSSIGRNTVYFICKMTAVFVSTVSCLLN